LAIDVNAYYRQYGPMVMRRCRQILKDESRAEDAMHDVFVELLRREDQLREQAPSSLLYRIATNTCLNRLRSVKRRREDASETLIERIATADESEASAARQMLSRLFGKEPESSRVIAVLHLVDGMTLEQVADEVQLSVSGVRKRLRKLRAQVAELERV
jgi:RNA polymerase sigma-70 factor (ECF subfamily)